MRATTTERVRAFIQPGDEIVNSRAEVHGVFKVMHSGYGFAGVLLTSRMNGNGSLTYCVWTVSLEGDIRCTMTAGDYPATSGAFEARVIKMLRAESGMTEGSTV